MAVYLGSSNITMFGGQSAVSGTLSITSNGTYNVASYVSADVNIADNFLDRYCARDVPSQINNSTVSSIDSFAFYRYDATTTVSFQKKTKSVFLPCRWRCKTRRSFAEVPVRFHRTARASACC